MKNVRDPLTDAETRYRSIVESASESLVVTQGHAVRYCNPRTSELTGYSVEEISSTDFIEFIHPDDRETVMREYRERLSGENPSNTYRVRIITKGGQERRILVKSVTIDWGGEPASLTVLRDITEQELAKEALRTTEDLLHEMMAQSPLAMEILTPDGRIREVNAAWARLWGADEETTEEVLATYNMITDPQLEDLGVAPLVRRAFAGEAVVLPPFRYDAKLTLKDFGMPDREVRSPWIQSHLYSVKDEAGRIEYVVNHYLDITELREAERDAREQREALARVDRAKSLGRLTGSIAHELNQPLTGILSNAQAAEIMISEGRYEPPELTEIMTEIAADAKRAGEVIRSLRELYREQPVDFQPVDINALVDDTVRLLHSEFVVQHVVPSTVFAPSAPLVNGNRIQIQQVLVNLITNGNQAMSELEEHDRQLTVATDHDEHEVRAWVEDRGPGIDADRIERIFEPLMTWKPGGTGMGLAISSSIVEAHGGRVWAENRPEGGARVGFAIPVLKGDLGT